MIADDAFQKLSDTAHALGKLSRALSGAYELPMRCTLGSSPDGPALYVSFEGSSDVVELTGCAEAILLERASNME